MSHGGAGTTDKAYKGADADATRHSGFDTGLSSRWPSRTRLECRVRATLLATSPEDVKRKVYSLGFSPTHEFALSVLRRIDDKVIGSCRRCHWLNIEIEIGPRRVDPEVRDRRP